VNVEMSTFLLIYREQKSKMGLTLPGITCISV